MSGFRLLIGVGVLLCGLVWMPVGARALQPGAETSCLACHENLYYLHDTGNWYCIEESPMGCVDCHGGNPAALNKDDAHFDRAAHPVINQDVQKCYQCHPGQADVRIGLFDEAAGISEVRVAVPYQPVERDGAMGFPILESDRWFLNAESATLWIGLGFLAVFLVAAGLKRG